MIKFRSLMQAIHHSVNSASKSVEKSSANYISNFFYKVEDGRPVSESLSSSGDFDFNAEYHPKTVTINFPSNTSDGVKNVEAEVPLIAITPISAPKVEHVKFTADLEVSIDDKGDLAVSFPDNKSSKGKIFDNRKEKTHNVNIEICINGGEPPEGLQKIIEGYERALRAQIPG